MVQGWRETDKGGVRVCGKGGARELVLRHLEEARGQTQQTFYVQQRRSGRCSGGGDWGCYRQGGCVEERNRAREVGECVSNNCRKEHNKKSSSCTSNSLSEDLIFNHKLKTDLYLLHLHFSCFLFHFDLFYLYFQ